MEWLVWMVVGGVITLLLEHFSKIKRSYDSWKSERIYKNSIDITKLNGG